MIRNKFAKVVICTMEAENRFCYIDFDIGNYRNKLSVTAAFIDATDTRYGFSSKDLRRLGGSEISRVGDLLSCDHGECVKLTN